MLNMSSKISTNHNLKIISKLKKKDNWSNEIENVKLPKSITFSLTGDNATLSSIVSSVWNFSDGLTSTEILSTQIVTHKFESSTIYNNTLMIYATACSADMHYKIPFCEIKIVHDKNYIDPEIFKNQILICHETGNISDSLAESIQKIAQRLGYRPNFINYHHIKEEMIGDAIIKMIEALRKRKFNPTLGYNPFLYFTAIAFNAFVNRIKKDKKDKELLHSFQEQQIQKMVSMGIAPPSLEVFSNHEDDNNDFIE